jgi:hypothetical protein
MVFTAMDHPRFETLKQEIAAHASVDQLVDLEAQTARLLSEACRRR